MATAPDRLLSFLKPIANLPNLLLIAGIFSFLTAGCGRQPQPKLKSATEQEQSIPLAKPPEVTSESEQGFHDLVFYIHEHKLQPDGTQTIWGQGTHKGRQLGFVVTLGSTWRGNSLGNLQTHAGKVTYRSVGPESDAFLQVLDELYSTKLNPKAMSKQTDFTAISLEGEPSNLAKGAVRIKLFFESDKENEYAELYTNIDLPAHRLEVHEKDADYRAAVVKALQAH